MSGFHPDNKCFRRAGHVIQYTERVYIHLSGSRTIQRFDELSTAENSCRLPPEFLILALLTPGTPPTCLDGVLISVGISP